MQLVMFLGETVTQRTSTIVGAMEMCSGGAGIVSALGSDITGDSSPRKRKEKKRCRAGIARLY